MRAAWALLTAALAGCGATPPAHMPGPLPPPDATPLPARSPRNASYRVEARLDPHAHTIDGRLVLEWRNLAGVPLQSFPFHLYWNAFRNTLSTSARGSGRRAARSTDADRGFGYLDVRSVRVLDAARPEGTDVTATLRYLSPEGNADDRTVAEVTAPSPVPPGGSISFAIDWTARIPYGDVGRAGWVHDYHLIAQWFPKVGVYWKNAWNAHAFHPWTEFFADYGLYDVTLTLPRGFVVGATGRLQERRENADGTDTLRFVAEDVHDFAWTASRRFRERTARFEEPGYPPVDIRLLVQPEHEHLSERYLEATKIALRSYGTWSVPYPYGHVTVVDPAWGSASGGMEYPAFFTGGGYVWAPRALQAPEGVTVHEAGHQFWYGLVASNEFEEAWLDEGINSYHEEKAVQLALGPAGWGKRYFGLRTPTRGRRGGWPVVAPGVWIGRGENDLSALRRSGETDVMARPGWHYLDQPSYTLNSYGKPSLTLLTLERLVGDETMTRIMRTYARRHLFGHPTTADFIAVVNEVTGRDYRWFFEQTWFSAELCDYAVTVENTPARAAAGFVEGPDGRPVPVTTTPAGSPPRAPAAERFLARLRRFTRRSAMSDGERGAEGAATFDGEVVVRRLGGVRMPVEVRVELEGGRTATTTWDGQDRWMRLRHPGARVTRAVVDPARRIAIDVDPSNNSWTAEEGVARRGATRWAARYLLWLQHLLELHTVVS